MKFTDDFYLKLNTILPSLACPRCYSKLTFQGTDLVCTGCHGIYPITNGIVELCEQSDTLRSDVVDWTKHWSSSNQNSLAQRFFSFYRKAVFARTVSYFIDHYFPDNGIFIEAGSGTSETSMRINKLSGNRLLIAVDIILPVLEHTHPIMDLCICGDIFKLPFQDNSLDGLWNVGVMEHFTHDQIDHILGEFNRVLKPRAPILLLWPSDNSVPQKMLRSLEKIINVRNGSENFRFHPDEISKLKSVEECRTILKRHGFNVSYIDNGLRSLFAFITSVGVKIESI